MNTTPIQPRGSPRTHYLARPNTRTSIQGPFPLTRDTNLTFPRTFSYSPANTAQLSKPSHLTHSTVLGKTSLFCKPSYSYTESSNNS
ncbi:hypothetical protein HYC85_029532 [Camellia sinensis]|uniref:Uncharacterized protein n=1 Tax=Camellia sinensis TaxID=4442 RepID=A0A7J7FZJ5_CAMSI|nr:hypothetical protein HYC85_029532 [Camellia sinensis]